MIRILLLICLFITGLTHAQNALDFDGTNDYVDCGSDTSLQGGGNTITIEAWINASSWKTNVYEGNIVVKEENTNNYGYMLRAGAGGKLNFAVGNGSWRELTSKNNVLSLNTWHHIAGTFDGTFMRIFVDGVLTDSMSSPGLIGTSSTTPLTIGNHSTYARNWAGKIDEVRLWAICRTPTQIVAYKDKEICGSEKGLRAYYKFNQGKAAGFNTSIKTLTDLSGYGNHGSVNGFDLSGAASNWVLGKTLTKDAVNSTLTLTRCNRYTFPSKKKTVTATGIYYDTIPNYMGCDSAIRLELTIYKSTTSSISKHVCDSFVGPTNVVYKKTGTYTALLKNWLGCDSTVTINLIVGGDSAYETAKQCYSYQLPRSKKWVTQSGLYIDSFKNRAGCDSLFFYTVTISQATSKTFNLSLCNFVTSPDKKYTFKEPGIKIDTLVNANGCDSFVTYNVFSAKTFGKVTLSSCSSVLSPSKKKTYTKSGVYLDTIPNKALCDSIITVTVNILGNSNTTANISGCRFVWSPTQNKRFTKSGVYKDTLKNYLGCDSILTLNVTVTDINTQVTLAKTNPPSLTANATGLNYRWLDCENAYQFIAGETAQIFSPKSAGIYAVELKQDNCLDTSECTTVQFANVANINDFEVLVYPNPSTGEFHLTLPENIELQSLEVFNLQGVKVASLDVNKQQRTWNVQSILSPGMYLLEFKSQNGKQSTQRLNVLN